MANSQLPEKIYPDWSRFVAAVWTHGFSHKHMVPEFAGAHSFRAGEAMREAVTQRNNAASVRPSAFLSCARQSFLFLQGEQPSPMPDNIGLTFAIGHVLHELSHAAMRSAIPEGFELLWEHKVTMPSWWPDRPDFNQGGTADCVIHVDDETKVKYLPEDAPNSMLVDFKSMGGYTFREHGKKVFGQEPDGFGYLAQLAIYSDALGLTDGALLAGINRDVLMSPLKPRFIGPEVLAEELQRVKDGINNALEGIDPGLEFYDRWKDNGAFYCGKGGRKGYCPFAQSCKDRPAPS